MRSLAKILSSLAIVLTFASVTRAEDIQPARWSLGAGVGPNFSQLDAVGDDLKSSIGGAVWLSREWGERSRLDISFDYFDFDSAGTAYPALSLGYGWRFFTDSKLKPFVLVGAGVGEAKNFPHAIDTDQTVPHFFARAGVKEIFGGERWSVGALYDFFFVKLDGKDADSALLGLPMLTLTWNFDDGKDSPPEIPAVSSTPKPRIDSDGDGVYDDKDECPDTPYGSKVNSIGCLPKQAVTKRLEIEFDTGKSVVKAEYYPVIDAFGAFMVENSDLTVTIEGHTDSTGSRKLNLKLSNDRAAAVREALLGRHKIAKKRLGFKGYGPDKPVGSNDTDEGRQKNRRVVAVVTSK